MTDTTANVAEEGNQTRLNEASKKFIADCFAEKQRLGKDFPLAAMLFDEAIDRVQATGRIPGQEFHANVFKQKLMKVSQKVFIPTKQFPHFNFIGKILGPKGNSLRALQKETMCWVHIKGRNSIRDPSKEEELRQSGDPWYAHLNKDTYLEISTVATPAEAYARVAYALSEIRKYLIPDSNDEVSLMQRKEIFGNTDRPRKAGGNALNFGQQRDQSILEKMSVILDDTPGNEETEEDEASHKSQMQRPPIKISVQGPSGKGEKKPIVSILKRVTTSTVDTNDDEQDEKNQDETEPSLSSYEAEEERSMKTFTPARKTALQGTPGKRLLREPGNKNDSPAKRAR